MSLQIGDWVWDKLRNSKVQVLEKNELWGYTSYRVFAPALKEVYSLTADQLNPTYGISENQPALIRYLAGLARFKNLLAGGILSTMHEGLIPLPHQLYALNRVINTKRIRYLLADEVGLGKTIEAGLIIQELKARGLVRRILVVCPKGLITQWQLEMHLIALDLPGLENEKGIWSLWELSIGTEIQDKKAFALFVNDQVIVRPASALRIWEELLKSSVHFEVRGHVPLSEENYQAIYSKAQEVAYDHFLEMKAAFEQRLQTEYEKTKYAWQLKMEATERIGIENIKKHRKERLLKEQQKMEDDFAARKVVPRLKALLLVRME